MNKYFAALLPLAFLLPACCTTPTLAPPATISLTQQVDVLNQRAALVTGLRAPGAQVWVQFKDDGGHTQSYTLDGSLLFRQYANPAGEQAADVLLVGRYAGQDVFELGSNQTDHWMAIRREANKAYIGKIGGPGAGMIPLMAEDVAKVLAIARLYENLAQSPAALRLAMTIQDQPEPPTNEVYIIHTPTDRPAWIERIEVVNRRTGDVDEVRMYRPDGVLEATARLSDYRAADGDGVVVETQALPPAPRLPHKFQLDYPGRQAKLELTFGTMKLAPELLGPAGRRAFATPNFGEQGLEIIDVDAPRAAAPPGAAKAP